MRELARVIRLLRDAGVTILLIEQNMKLAEVVADELHIMVKGRMVYSADPQRFRAEEQQIRSALPDGVSRRAHRARRPLRAYCGTELSPSPSGNSMTTLSSQRPNLWPTEWMVPQNLKPARRCSVMEAKLAESPIIATISR